MNTPTRLRAARRLSGNQGRQCQLRLEGNTLREVDSLASGTRIQILCSPGHAFKQAADPYPADGGSPKGERSTIYNHWLPLLLALCLAAIAPRLYGQASSPSRQAPAAASPAVRIDLDQAIQMALAHNRALQAARTLIPQSQAEEITASLRPNPVLTGDGLFIPLFSPSSLNGPTLNDISEFDLGVSYLFERGHKRQARIRAARNQTAVTESSVKDDERLLTFNVGGQFIQALLAQSTLSFAEQDLASFQKTVGISQSQFQAGGISKGDFLMTKLQLLQFQTDVSAARVALVQSLAALRQLVGFDSVPASYGVIGNLAYTPLRLNLLDLEAKALAQRPDLIEAKQGVTAANSQYALAKANGKRDFTGQLNYTHVSALNNVSVFGSIQIPIFDRNQGEIARTHFAITQSQEAEQGTADQVLTDVKSAFAAYQTSAQVVNLYESGYLKEAQESRDISQYAYRRGAASLLTFLDAERTYRATQLAYRQALAAYMTSVEQLREAVGTRNLP
ncbi:MAG: TolC family protein [Acidobacteriota bacterium]|nr:TolC family protein [Acidobacteriota bacterium]